MVYFPFRIWKALLSTSFTYLFMLLDLRYIPSSRQRQLSIKIKARDIDDDCSITCPALSFWIWEFLIFLEVWIFNYVKSILPNSQVRSFLRCRISFHRMTLMVNNHCRIFYSIKISNEDVDWYIYIYISMPLQRRRNEKEGQIV